MQIVASIPTLISSTAPVIYDRWWVTKVQIEANDPTNVWAYVSLRKCYFDANGLPVFGNDSPSVQYTLGQLLSDPDPNVQSAIQSLLTAVVIKASALNLI